MCAAVAEIWVLHTVSIHAWAAPSGIHGQPNTGINVASAHRRHFNKTWVGVNGHTHPHTEGQTHAPTHRWTDTHTHTQMDRHVHAH